MANGPMIHELSRLNNYNNISVGVHLVLDEFQSLSKSETFARHGITDNQGVFQRDRISNFTSFSKDLQLAVKDELQMQINVIRNWRKNISHVDSHHHVHNNPAVLEIIADLCRENNIPSIRRPYALTPWQRLRTRKKKGVKSIGRLPSNKTQVQKSLFKKVRYEMNAMTRYNDSLHLLKSFKTTDDFFSVATFLDLNIQQRKSKPKTIELMCHPGHPSYSTETFTLADPLLWKKMELLLINYSEV